MDLIDTNIINDKPKQTRVKRASWRYNDDGTYNNKPLGDDYFNKYYHDNLSVKIQCPHCKKMIVKQTLSRHISTVKKCLEIQNKIL